METEGQGTVLRTEGRLPAAAGRGAGRPAGDGRLQTPTFLARTSVSSPPAGTRRQQLQQQAGRGAGGGEGGDSPDAQLQLAEAEQELKQLGRRLGELGRERDRIKERREEAIRSRAKLELDVKDIEVTSAGL